MRGVTRVRVVRVASTEKCGGEMAGRLSECKPQGDGRVAASTYRHLIRGQLLVDCEDGLN